MTHTGTTKFPAGLAISDFEPRNAALLSKRAALTKKHGEGDFRAQVADDMQSFDWSFEVAAL